VRLPSLRFLKTFQIAARLQSFKEAADELFLTPSAVSHQIKSLEEQLGVSLFERGARSLSLTDAGTAYLEHVNEAFARLESVTEQLQVRYGRKIIRLVAPPFFASELLLPRLGSFSQAHEQTDIRIETAQHNPISHTAEADLSIVVGTGPWEDVRVHRLFAQSFVPAASPALLSSNAIRSSADLNGQTLIVQEDRRDAWDRWAASLGHEPLQPNRVVRLDSMSAVARAAEQGLGIALVPARLSQERFTLGSLVKVFEFELTTNESYFLLHRAEDDERTEIHDLTQWILRQCRSTDFAPIGDQ
jgi:LysR family transcriptional regulator, glycine cleavage system transcriptional activator